MKCAIMAFLLIAPLALAIGGTQIGSDALVAFGEEAVFKVLVSGNPTFSIEKPEGWEVKITESGKEYVSAGSSYHETRAYSVRIKPSSPSGTVIITAVEKGDSEGIRVDKALSFRFHVAIKSSVIAQRESSIKTATERVSEKSETPSPGLPPGIWIAVIVTLLWLVARKSAVGRPKKSAWKI